MKHRIGILLLLGLLVVMGVNPSIAQEDEFLFGVILVGPANDGGWSQAHVEGADYAVSHLPGTDYVMVESLNSSDSPEATLRSVVQDFADQGVELIFTTSDAFQIDTVEIAGQFPEITFVNISGDDVPQGIAPPNLSNFTGQLLLAREMAGCAAALTTQTGKIGLLAPLINDETRRDEASAYLGAKYCWEHYRGGDPESLVFTVTWIGFWFNIPGVTLDPTEEVQSFFDNGADVVISGIDTTEALVVAESRRSEGDEVWAVGTDSRTLCTTATPAETCLGSQYYNWGPSYTSTIQQVMDGTWTQSFQWLTPDWTDINDTDTSNIGFTYGAGLTEEAQASMDDFISMQAAFSQDPDNANYLPLWCGPLNYQDGTELAAAGECVEAFPSDMAQRETVPSVWYLPQLLEGMIGASE